MRRRVRVRLRVMVLGNESVGKSFSASSLSRSSRTAKRVDWVWVRATHRSLEPLLERQRARARARGTARQYQVKMMLNRP
jgi:nicotinamide riboside kinase